MLKENHQEFSSSILSSMIEGDTVQAAAVSAEVREVLGQVLEFWFFERFRGLTAKEIWAMLNLVTPIEETRAYQSIFAANVEDLVGSASG